MSLRYRLASYRELYLRYKQIWLHFWRHRKLLTPPDLKEHEAEFLPAALSIQTRPVSPASRWIAGVISSLVVVLLAWSIIGRSDIVVLAPAQVIPSGRTKTIMAVEVANVRAIYVKEGQRVRQGEVLIALDARMSDVDTAKFQSEWEGAFLQAGRARCFIHALDTGQLPPLPSGEGVSHNRWEDAQRQLIAQWRDYLARRTQLDGEIRRYQQALRLATQRAGDFADLLRTRDVSEHAWIDREQQRIDLAGQLTDSGNRKAILLADSRRSAEDSLNEALKMMASAQQDIRRAQLRSESQQLVSPVDGTIQQLAVNTVGTAVPATQPLMQIVPADTPVELQAWIENKDIGFVREGQVGAVKIDAFNFSKYGTVPGRVTHVSRDAIQDEKKGALYSIRVELTRNTMMVEGREMRLSPGMSGQVEIKTGSRRIIEYILSPLVEHIDESFHER